MSKFSFELNREIERFVLEKSTTYTEQDIAYVNKYVGYGGMWNRDTSLAKERGLYEYYTPIEVVEKMVGLALKYGYQGGPVMEPSCGIGRFLHYFSPETDLTAIELDKTSFLIAQANFPSFTILNQYFNELFVDRRGNARPFQAKYELVIGNPPYGAFAGKFTNKEKGVTKANTYVDYFVSRGLDLLQPGGLLIYIIPSAFLNGQKTKPQELIDQKSELLDAYRLPNGIFSQTDIQTDIVVLKKK
ncbi:MAG: N-6 DNA methylase [Saprospiraceae bacterium]|nr:N-6 DNA methylase [Saprospiraceae bacterium]